MSEQNARKRCGPFPRAVNMTKIQAAIANPKPISKAAEWKKKNHINEVKLTTKRNNGNTMWWVWSTCLRFDL
jgi:hypothetical protein